MHPLTHAVFSVALQLVAGVAVAEVGAVCVLAVLLAAAVLPQWSHALVYVCGRLTSCRYF